MSEFKIGDRVIIAGEVRKLARCVTPPYWGIDAPIRLITEWHEGEIQPYPYSLGDVCERLDDIKRLLEWLTDEVTGRN